MVHAIGHGGQGFTEILFTNRFAQIAVHPGGEAFLAIADHGPEATMVDCKLGSGSGASSGMAVF